MADSELKQSSDNDILEMTKDLERMIEDVEKISAQLSWMAYDMVVLRTSPGLHESMQRLEEAFLSCRAVICGGNDQEMPKEAEDKRFT